MQSETDQPPQQLLAAGAEQHPAPQVQSSQHPASQQPAAQPPAPQQSHGHVHAAQHPPPELPEAEAPPNETEVIRMIAANMVKLLAHCAMIGKGEVITRAASNNAGAGHH